MQEKKLKRIKPNKKQLKIIKKYWDKLEYLEDYYFSWIKDLEEEMEKETGIEGIEFFMCDNSYVGVGNADRTMTLICLR